MANWISNAISEAQRAITAMQRSTTPSQQWGGHVHLRDAEIADGFRKDAARLATQLSIVESRTAALEEFFRRGVDYQAQYDFQIEHIARVQAMLTKERAAELPDTRVLQAAWAGVEFAGIVYDLMRATQEAHRVGILGVVDRNINSGLESAYKGMREMRADLRWPANHPDETSTLILEARSYRDNVLRVAPATTTMAIGVEAASIVESAKLLMSLYSAGRGLWNRLATRGQVARPPTTLEPTRAKASGTSDAPQDVPDVPLDRFIERARGQKLVKGGHAEVHATPTGRDPIDYALGRSPVSPKKVPFNTVYATSGYAEADAGYVARQLAKELNGLKPGEKLVRTVKQGGPVNLPYERAGVEVMREGATWRSIRPVAFQQVEAVFERLQSGQLRLTHFQPANAVPKGTLIPSPRGGAQ